MMNLSLLLMQYSNNTLHIYTMAISFNYRIQREHLHTYKVTMLNSDSSICLTTLSSMDFVLDSIATPQTQG